MAGTGSAGREKAGRSGATAEDGIRPHRGTLLAGPDRVLALDDEDLPVTERPTIPVPTPMESEVRLRVTRVPWIAATVDVVVCDLSRDPRSESFACPANDVVDLRGAGQNDRPPSTSTVRALK
jgi:hypothetical protein